MQYLVDLQGFKQPVNDYVLKELALVAVEPHDAEPTVLLFKPPYSWKRLTNKYKSENEWLKRRYHGLQWDSGDHEYVDIANVLRRNLPKASRIIVNNEIKKKWLERFVDMSVLPTTVEILNIQDISYAIGNLPKTTTVCPHHNAASGRKINCALHNVKYMKQFYCRSDEMEWEDIEESLSPPLLSTE